MWLFYNIWSLSIRPSFVPRSSDWEGIWLGLQIYPLELRPETIKYHSPREPWRSSLIHCGPLRYWREQSTKFIMGRTLFSSACSHCTQSSGLTGWMDLDFAEDIVDWSFFDINWVDVSTNWFMRMNWYELGCQNLFFFRNGKGECHKIVSYASRSR